jgi:hypothetical protein
MQPELLMAGETVHGKTNGRMVLVADRMRCAMGYGYEPQIMNVQTAGGLSTGHNGMQASAHG